MENAWYLSSVSKPELTATVKCGTDESLDGLSKDLSRIVALAVECDCTSANVVESNNSDPVVNILFGNETGWKNFCTDFPDL